MTIKAIGLEQFGGPEVLHIVEVPQPQPGPGQVRIRVAAAGVNPTDATFRSGGRAAQLEGEPMPYIPGMDLAGTIDSIGDAVNERLHIGDNVIALVLPFTGTRGAYTTSIVVDQRSVVHAPRNSTPAGAATLLLNGVTATLALDALNLSEGDVLAITGATGAVGTYATALAKQRQLIVVADSRPGREEAILTNGADIALPRGPEFITGLLQHFPNGAAGLVDAASLNASALSVIAENGAIASLKGWAGPTERGIRLEAISSFGAVTNTALLEQVRDQASSGILKLQIAEIFEAANTDDAHRRLNHGGLNGRLVLDMTTLQ